MGQKTASTLMAATNANESVIHIQWTSGIASPRTHALPSSRAWSRCLKAHIRGFSNVSTVCTVWFVLDSVQ